MVDPDRWLEVLDGRRYVRKVQANGVVSVNHVGYYVDHTWAGKYVSLRIDAAQRVFVVEYREHAVKAIPINGLIGKPMALEVYLAHMALEARTNQVMGRPVGYQLRLV
jgi:hypothetical protein